MAWSKFVVGLCCAVLAAPTSAGAFSLSDLFGTSVSAQMIAACEAALKKRLVQPSSYRQIEAVARVEPLALDVYYALNTGESKAVQNFRRQSGATAQRVVAVLDYNAAVPAGGTVRRAAECTYETIGKIDGISEHVVRIDGKSHTEWLVTQLPRPPH
jgi:hypothetical protein